MKRQEDLQSGYIIIYLKKVLFHGNLSHRKTLILSIAEAEFVRLTECTKASFMVQKNLFKKII